MKMKGEQKICGGFGCALVCTCHKGTHHAPMKKVLSCIRWCWPSWLPVRYLKYILNAIPMLVILALISWAYSVYIFQWVAPLLQNGLFCDKHMTVAQRDAHSTRTQAHHACSTCIITCFSTHTHTHTHIARTCTRIPRAHTLAATLAHRIIRRLSLASPLFPSFLTCATHTTQVVCEMVLFLLSLSQRCLCCVLGRILLLP